MRVITYFGRMADRLNCRYIQGHYYEMNTECVSVNGQWHRIANNKVGFDLIEKSWKLLEDIPRTYEKIIYGFHEELPLYGYLPVYEQDRIQFVPISKTHYKVGQAEYKAGKVRKILDKGLLCDEVQQAYLLYSEPKKDPKTIELWYEKVYAPKLVTILENVEGAEYLNYVNLLCSEELALSSGHIEDPATGIFYKQECLNKPEIERMKEKRTYQLSVYDRRYTSNGHPRERETREMSSLYAAKLSTTNIDRLLAKLISYRWGVEHETREGFIPERRLPMLGLVPLRDGSLQGGLEYTSIPLSGEEGFKLLRVQARMLTKYCTVSNLCAWHVHFSGFPNTWEYVMNMYKICYQLQDELFAMFPLYKRDSINLLGTSKEYTAPLSWFNSPTQLFTYLSSEMSDSKIEKYGVTFEGPTPSIPIEAHPRGDQKWNRPGRYHWINFEPLFFSSARTIEFRLHTPTTNFTKMALWMLICTAIMEYAKSHQTKKGASLSLKTVMNAVYEPDVADYLCAYIELRKTWFLNDEDSLGAKEFEKDGDFRFFQKKIEIA